MSAFGRCSTQAAVDCLRLDGGARTLELVIGYPLRHD
jgi:hypothetical protein